MPEVIELLDDTASESSSTEHYSDGESDITLTLRMRHYMLHVRLSRPSKLLYIVQLHHSFLANYVKPHGLFGFNVRPLSYETVLRERVTHGLLVELPYGYNVYFYSHDDVAVINVAVILLNFWTFGLLYFWTFGLLDF